MWSTTNPILKPAYTKTSDSFDLVAKLFDIITRQGDKAFDEGHNGEDEGLRSDRLGLFLCSLKTGLATSDDSNAFQMTASAFRARS